MQGVYILTKRMAYTNKSYHDTKIFMQDLHQRVVQFPGFINAKSYWNTEFTCLYTISKWESTKSWDEWKKSEMRNEVINKYLQDKIGEEHQEVYKFCESIFLL